MLTDETQWSGMVAISSLRNGIVLQAYQTNNK